MTRLPGWEGLLHAFLERKAGVSFTWGATDCCMFSADAVEAITGVDPAAAFRGRYSTAGGATRALKRYGAGSIEATIDTKFEAVGRAFARRGDLVLMDGMVGVCIGGDAVFVGEEQRDGTGVAGLVRFPRARWSKAWRVG